MKRQNDVRNADISRNDNRMVNPRDPNASSSAQYESRTLSSTTLESLNTARKGRWLLQQLDQYIEDLRRVSPTLSFSIFDMHDVLIRKVRAHSALAVPEERWHRFDVAIHNIVYGYLYTSTPLKEVMDETTQSLYSLRLALLLTELLEWAATEAERRGEKIQKVLMEGVTAENAHLLSLCGLHAHPGYTVVAMELHEPERKFQIMDVLRRFMIANIWCYQDEFPFLAYRPNGILGIFAGVDPSVWTTTSHAWIKAWEAYQSRISEKPLSIRLYVTKARDEKHIGAALRETELVMRYADKSGYEGILSHHVSPAVMRVLTNLSDVDLIELVHSTLGPLLEPEHQHLRETLKVYLTSGQNATKAGQALFLHRNTLLYRIHQIEQLLGASLRNLQDLTAIWTALQALELLNMFGKNITGDGTPH